MANNPSIAFFHPYQNNKGFGLVINFAPDRGTFFARFMPEIDGGFTQSASINIAIGSNDLGEILAVLNGRKAGVGNFKDNRWNGLYHDLKAKNTVTILNFYANEDKPSYAIGVSQKIGGGEPRRVGGNLTLGEVSLLKAFFESHMTAFFEAQSNMRQERVSNDGGGGGNAKPSAPATPPPAASKPSGGFTGGKKKNEPVDDGSSPF